MQVQDGSKPSHKSTSCLSIASASKMHIYSRDEAGHVISLVLFACRRLLVCKMGQRIDRSVCEYHVFDWAPRVLGGGERSHEAKRNEHV